MVVITINGSEVRRKFERITWGGDIQTSSRYIEVTGYDLVVGCGDTAELFNRDGKRLFIGKVFRVDKDTDTESVTFKCYDNAFYLNKNFFVKNFYNLAPSEITKQIISEIGLETGEFPQDKLKCTFPAIDRSAYDIIMSCYTMQNAKDDIIYTVVSEDNKINIIEQGTLITNYELSSKTNIRTASYSSSIEDLITKVIVYKTEKEKTQIIDTKSNPEDIKKYGVFQVVQQQTEENKAILDSQKILKGIVEKGQIQVNGMNDLVSGYTVAVAVKSIDLIGTFLIEYDMHTWEADDYYCDLSLSFENVMNKVDADKYEEKTGKKTKKKVNREKKEKPKQINSKSYYDL
ncbi:MAG: XkdQ/YqbQ family protein [Fusobacteriaceae bacterium]